MSRQSAPDATSRPWQDRQRLHAIFWPLGGCWRAHRTRGAHTRGVWLSQGRRQHVAVRILRVAPANLTSTASEQARAHCARTEQAQGSSAQLVHSEELGSRGALSVKSATRTPVGSRCASKAHITRGRAVRGGWRLSVSTSIPCARSQLPRRILRACAAKHTVDGAGSSHMQFVDTYTMKRRPTAGHPWQLAPTTTARTLQSAREPDTQHTYGPGVGGRPAPGAWYAVCSGETERCFAYLLPHTQYENSYRTRYVVRSHSRPTVFSLMQ